MTVAIERALPADAAGLKAFMAHVIASDVTQDPALLADLRANVEGNVDWWLTHPDAGVHR